MENTPCLLCREHGFWATAQSGAAVINLWAVRRYGTEKNYWNQSELKCVFFPGLSELKGTKSPLSLCLVVAALAGFGREKREYRKSWMFRLGFNLRIADAKFGRLFLRQFAFGDEFRRSKYFIEKRASGFGPSALKYYSAARPQKRFSLLLLRLIVRKKNVLSFFSSFVHKFLNCSEFGGCFRSVPSTAKNSLLQAFR